MPDITMCSSEQCPIRQRCYRHEAKPNPYRQAYNDFYDAEKFASRSNVSEYQSCAEFVEIER